MPPSTESALDCLCLSDATFAYVWNSLLASWAESQEICLATDADPTLPREPKHTYAVVPSQTHDDSRAIENAMGRAGPVKLARSFNVGPGVDVEFTLQSVLHHEIGNSCEMTTDREPPARTQEDRTGTANVIAK